MHVWCGVHARVVWGAHRRLGGRAADPSTYSEQTCFDDLHAVVATRTLFFEPVIFPTRPISRFGWDDARAASTVVPEKCCCSAEAARTRCSTSACALLPPQHGRAIATTTAANTQRHEQNESIVWVARL